MHFAVVTLFWWLRSVNLNVKLRVSWFFIFFSLASLRAETVQVEFPGSGSYCRIRISWEILMDNGGLLCWFWFKQLSNRKLIIVSATNFIILFYFSSRVWTSYSIHAANLLWDVCVLLITLVFCPFRTIQSPCPHTEGSLV